MAYYKDMIAFRKANPSLARGKMTFVSLPEPLLAFTRRDDAQTLTCIFNLSKNKHTVDLSAQVEIVKGMAATVADNVLTLDGNGFVYLSQEGDSAV